MEDLKRAQTRRGKSSILLLTATCGDPNRSVVERNNMPDIDWAKFAYEKQMESNIRRNETDFWRRPSMRLLTSVAMILAVIPCAILWSYMLPSTVEYLRHPLGRSPEQGKPATFTVESTDGNAVVYVDSLTGARVLCSAGSSCVVLPMKTSTAR